MGFINLDFYFELMNVNNPYKETLAFVYLLREGDEKNVCLLSSKDLTIIRNKKERIFELKNLKNLTFSSKLLLLPIILGGVFGPFFFIAILGNYFHPLVNLLGFLLSVLLFYYGFSGKQALRIETINDVQEVFLAHISENLKSFVNFANHLIYQNQFHNEAFTFYIPVTRQEKEMLMHENKFIISEDGIFGYTADEFKKHRKDEEVQFVEIDARKEDVKIKFENDDTGRLRPKFYGEILSIKIHK